LISVGFTFDPRDVRVSIPESPPRARPLADQLPKVGPRRMGAEIARRSPTVPTTTSRPQARPSFGKPPLPRSARRPQLSPPPSPAQSRSLGSDQSKKPTPQDDPDQKKIALGISVGSAPAPLPAGSVHNGIRPQRYPSTTVSVHNGIRPRCRRGPPILRAGSKVGGRRSGQRIPFSLSADNTLAEVRLYPVEANVEVGAAGPSPPEGGGGGRRPALFCGKSGGVYRFCHSEVERRRAEAAGRDRL